MAIAEERRRENQITIRRKALDQELTQKVKDFTKSIGADIVGITSVEPLWERHQEDIKHIFPKATNIIMFGVRHALPAITSDNLRVQQFNANHTFAYLGTMCHHLTTWLDRQGYGAAGITPSIPVSAEEGKWGYIGDISFRHAAVEAGLGHLGIHRLLITPELGVRVRLGCVLSDAPLVPDKKYDGKNFCYDCSACIKMCPVGAISQEKGVDVFKCGPSYSKWGWSGTFDFIEELINLDSKEERIRRLRSPDGWTIWQSMTYGTITHCFNCISNCAKVLHGKFGL